MSYLGAQPAPLGTELDADTVQTADIQDGAVTAPKLSNTAITDKLGFTPISTGKAIAMSLVFG